MAVEQTREIVTGYLQRLVARAPYEHYFAEDVTFTVMGSDQVVRGRAAVGEFIRFLHEVAFDARPVIKSTFVGETQAAVEADFVGTHTGEFLGVAPTGRGVGVPYAVVYDLAGGVITALRAYMPMDALLRQLGAVAAAPAAAV